MHNGIIPHGAPVDMPQEDKLEGLRHFLPVLWEQAKEVVMEDSIIPAQ